MDKHLLMTSVSKVLLGRTRSTLEDTETTDAPKIPSSIREVGNEEFIPKRSVKIIDINPEPFSFEEMCRRIVNNLAVEPITLADNRYLIPTPKGNDKIDFKQLISYIRKDK